MLLLVIDIPALVTLGALPQEVPVRAMGEPVSALAGPLLFLPTPALLALGLMVASPAVMGGGVWLCAPGKPGGITLAPQTILGHAVALSAGPALPARAASPASPTPAQLPSGSPPRQGKAKGAPAPDPTA